MATAPFNALLRTSLALGLFAACSAEAFAQGRPMGVPGGAVAQSAPAVGLAGGGAASAATAGTSAPGTLPGASLIENLNQALEQALAGQGAGVTNALIAPGMQPAASPVVVELFTSQGCSACPPADALLAEVAERPDVLALALHVDYWDYLGWEDPFAQPAFTARQKAYARAAGSRTIYTPQMIVGGAESLVAPNGIDLFGMIAAQQGVAPTVALHVGEGEAPGEYVIDLSSPARLAQGTVVQIVRYAPQARVEILRGENAGQVLDYVNVVTAWHAVAEWDGKAPLRLNAKIEGDEPAVVIVQTAMPGKSAPLPGAILAAGRLR